jgi:hypothetical protein
MTLRFVPVLAAAAGLLLSGCFMSEQPKFPMATAVAAFGDGGRYQVYERLKEDTYGNVEMIEIRHRADGRYDFVNPKGEAQPISLHPLANGNFVGQATSPEDGRGYGYVVFRTVGAETFIFVPQCSSQDKAKLDSLGVVAAGRYECRIDKVADPAAFFASLALGEPTSKMVREQ